MIYIKNYEGLYSINENGDIFSHVRNKLLKQYLSKDKNVNTYFEVSLSKNGFNKKYKVHRLLAESFIPNPSNKKFVDHIDRNKTNNSLENLRWSTRIENARNKGKTYRKNNTNIQSSYKGVSWSKKYGKWYVSSVNSYGKMVNLGLFDDEKEAALKYNEYTEKIFGEYCFLNKIL